MIRLGRLTWFLTIASLAASTLLISGCGTTRSSDTNRTATEQLLISDAIDRAVQTVELDTLAGQSVYLDDTKLGEIVDRNYLISTLRQHVLASGCKLRDKREDADFIVEARAGAIGTDRNDLLFGVPSMNVPQIMPMQPTPAAIPEIPIAKRRDQRGIAKIAVFAYHRESGTPVWQSGIAHQESSSNDVWILGAGPFQRGTIYEGTEFAGKALTNDGTDEGAPDRASRSVVRLDQAKSFAPAEKLANRETNREADTEPAEPAMAQASATTPQATSDSPAAVSAPSAAAPPNATGAVASPLITPIRTDATNHGTQASFEQLIPDFDRPLSDYVKTPDGVRDTEFSASIYQRPMVKRTGTMTVEAAPHARDDITSLPEPRIEGP